MKKLIALLMALVMVFSLCACGAKEEAPAAAPAAPAEAPAEEAAPAEASVVWKISTVDNEGSDYMNAFTAMWERIEKETNGYIDVEMYYANSLGDEPSILEGMQLGTIQGAQMATSVMANYSDY